MGILAAYSSHVFATSISTNLFIPRPFSTDMAREILQEKAAWDGIPKPDNWHGTFQVALQYNSMFNTLGDATHGIGARPFWNGTNTMTVGDNANFADSDFSAGGPYDVDGWQFGLGEVTTPGSITLNPKIHQDGAALLLYIGSRQYEQGFFIKFVGPINATVIDPGLTETTPTLAAYPEGVMQITSNSAGARGPFNLTMTQAFTGNFITNTNIAFVGLEFGKINGKQSSGARFGDINIALGYNFFADEKRHIGAALRFGAPTGNGPVSIYMLEPISGAGNSWMAGFEFIAHGTILEKQNTCIKVWFDAYAAHIFKGRQVRTFDAIINGPGSKYLLVGDFGTAGTTSQNNFQALINLTRLAVDTKRNVTIDSALLFDIEHLNWDIGIGYNFWGVSREHLSLEQVIASGRYGFVGHQPNIHLTGLLPPYYTLNKVDPTAKMNQYMPLARNTTGTLGTGVTAAPGSMINGAAALDIANEESPGAWSSKIFCRVAYQWKDTNLVPTLGLYASSEFSQSGNTAISQWGIALHGGISF